MPTAGIATCPEIETLKYTFILVTQGDHKFYNLTIPSENLAETCFVKNKGGRRRYISRRKIDQAPMAHVGAPINAESAKNAAAARRQRMCRRESGRGSTQEGLLSSNFARGAGRTKWHPAAHQQ